MAASGVPQVIRDACASIRERLLQQGVGLEAVQGRVLRVDYPDVQTLLHDAQQIGASVPAEAWGLVLAKNSSGDTAKHADLRGHLLSTLDRQTDLYKTVAETPNVGVFLDMSVQHDNSQFSHYVIVETAVPDDSPQTAELDEAVRRLPSLAMSSLYTIGLDWMDRLVPQPERMVLDFRTDHPIAHLRSVALRLTRAHARGGKSVTL